MPRMYHPTLQRRFVDVTDQQVEAHRKMGWLEGPKLPTTAGSEPDTVDQSPTMPAPAGNASKEEWVAYAVYRGLDREAAEDMSRDELRDSYS